MIYASSFVAYWGDQHSIRRIEDEVFSRYYEGGSGKDSGRSGDDSGAQTEQDEGVDPKKNKGRLIKHDSTDPLLLRGKARGNSLGNALDFLLLFQKYCVQGAGPTEERLEKEEQAKRRTESIEKVKGWEARSDSAI